MMIDLCGATWMRWLRGACLVVVLTAGARPARAVTTFLHHFDLANNGINNGAGPATYAVGNAAQLSLPPDGPGGTIVPGGRFNNALDRTSGGRIRYATAGNYNPLKGTIEMWVKGIGVTDTTFQSLWGLDTSSGNTDIRFYIYNDQANDNLRSLGGYQLNGGGAFWEIERPIPVDKLDNTNWHHVVWQWDTTTGAEVTALWWDGVLLGNTPDDGYSVSPRTTYNNTRMNIGESQVGSAPWKGSLDELRISDHLVYDVNNDFTPPTAPFSPPVSVVTGDFSGDGKVDAADLTLLLNNWGATVPPTPAGWTGFPPTAGAVDADELTALLNNWGVGAAVAAAIPEPSSAGIALAALVGMGCLCRPRGRS